MLSVTKPHILISGSIHQAGYDLLESADVTVERVCEPAISDFLNAIANADAVLLRSQRITNAELLLTSRLRVVSRHGVGYDKLDLGALSARGIALTTIGDANSQSVAEHTMMLMLTVARHAIKQDALVRDSRWWSRDGFVMRDLSGKTLLIVGYGRIGSRVARLAQAFQMRVMAYDPDVNNKIMTAAGVIPIDDLEAKLGTADFITLHCPAQADSKPVMNASRLAALRPGAMLINTSRGSVVDQEVMAAMLIDGRLAGAGIDVFEIEPPGAQDMLFLAPRLICSPHAASLTEDCMRATAIAAVSNILNYFDGTIDPTNVVNAEILEKNNQAPWKQ